MLRRWKKRIVLLQCLWGLEYEYANKLIAELKFEQLEMYTMNLIMGIR